MSLKEQLENTFQELKQQIPGPIFSQMLKATDELVESGLQNQIIKIGEQLPEITLPDALGNNLKINDLLKDGPLIISFYRGNWCPYCNLELSSLQNMLPRFQEAGANLIAISPQLPDQSWTMKQKNDLKFPVLSDLGNQAAEKMGLVFKMQDYLSKIYQDFNINLKQFNGDDSYELPIPGTFVINQDGKVIYAFADPDYTKRAEPKEILEAIQKEII